MRISIRERGRRRFHTGRSGRANRLQVTITFSDGGIPYNPLSRAEPDITLSAEERGIGGLGIYLVKKSMDDVVYEYRDGKNVLTIKKVLAIPTAPAK